MIAWVKEIFLPYLQSKGRRSDEWALLIMDPATGHRTEKVKAFLKANRICLAMMPASTTYKFQMIDVVVGKVFKDHMCDAWANWMFEECKKVGTTAAGNYKHPTYPDCLKWVVQSWAKLDTAGVRKTAKRLGMGADPGPIIPGYVDEHFQEPKPSGEEVEGSAPGSVGNDLPNED